MTTQTTSRLWPVLVTLVVLPVGAVGIEQYARARGARERIIKVEETEPQTQGDSAPVLAGAPLSPDHDAARAALRRGDAKAAAEKYDAVATAFPDSAAVAMERGAALVAARRIADAVASLERARTLAPQDEKVAVALARAYAKRKEGAASEAELRRALSLRPGYGPALLQLGRALLNSGKHEEAIELLTQAASFGGNEDRANAFVALGEALLAANRPEEARTAFDKGVERAPARVEVRLNIARAYLGTDKKDDVARATGVLAVAQNLAPDLADVRVLLGQAREQLGETDAAEEAYTQALQVAPQSALPRRRLLRIALSRQKLAKAQQLVDELLALDAEEPEHHFLAGLVARRRDAAATARAQYQRAIELSNGDYPEASFNLGLVEKDAGNVDAAVAAYRRAIELRPGYHAAENNLGLVLLAAGRYDEAEQTYKGVLSRSPSYAAGWLNLGRLYSQRKNYPAAVDAYQKALDAKPDYPRALLDLGVAYVRLNRVDDAIAAYKKVVALNPRSVAAQHNLALALLQKGGATTEAERLLRAVLEIDPGHAPSGRRLAALLIDKKDYAAARDLLDDILDEDPHDVDARVVRADVLLRLEDRAGCLRDARFVVTDNAGLSAIAISRDEKAVAELRSTAQQLVDVCSGAHP